MERENIADISPALQENGGFGDIVQSGELIPFTSLCSANSTAAHSDSAITASSSVIANAVKQSSIDCRENQGFSRNADSVDCHALRARNDAETDNGARNDGSAEIDVLEQDIQDLSPYLLKILLQDKTTGHYIRWACDEYAAHGEAYTAEKEIFPELITGANTKIIQPRTAKSKEAQKSRTRKAAEVFTPSWICNEMNNLCDEEWFGRKDVFNTVCGHNWTPAAGKIQFAADNGKKAQWQKYVDSRRLEITCGEAPFLTSRYDTTTGEVLPPERRIGLLDRKLRVVNENTIREDEWFFWAKRAYEATYGYEYQGDNLLLARENLLLAFCDNFKRQWHKNPAISQLKQIANIIAWNVWQMDGLKECAPFGKADAAQFELFDDLPTLNFPIICRVQNWRSKQVYNFRDLKGDKAMKFDFVIGNPPYQESNEDNNRQSPIYHLFMKNSYKIADCAELITPARFLFNAGQTPRDWNLEMLNDEHFKVLFHEPCSKNIFPNTDIKGGIAITYRDKSKTFGKIGTYTTFLELSSMLQKVINDPNFNSIITMIYPKSSYSLTKTLYQEHPELVGVMTKRNEYIIDANVFVKMSHIFLSKKPDDSNYVAIQGRENNARTLKYVKENYISGPANFNKYKVFIPAANGSGAIGEVLSTPLIGEPLIGHTQTFLSIGNFTTKNEAENCMKYIKTKFERALLGTLKVTQNNNRDVFRNVPLQDFTDKSDIDWSKSISEIDRQLYAKYGLSPEEISFIETNVKPME